ncbi:ATP-dependent metallopeptidase Hfl [Cristinia sonorae]|uniref:ATP-dependent metallopeptidase Hfl n=1 Tax=Cristinia sonorae TaxID=1940300 RepID=A0A8K0UYI3_9AGAR|nr:ATP-dependent metallopeptidase Hfl [Cristinia sonorae]
MNSPFMLFGALRNTLRVSRPPIHVLSQFRPLSTTSSISLLGRQHEVSRRIVPLLHSRRHLSLSSLLTPRKPNVTPEPAVMAKVLELEQAANAEPHNPQKQLAFFQALMDSGVKPGYDVVIARWERMCEFDPSNPLLRSDDAFTHYCDALVQVGLESSVESAARRRDSLLAAAGISTSSASAPTSSSVESPATTGTASSPLEPNNATFESVTATPSQDASTSSIPSGLTASQRIAHMAVTSRPATSSKSLSADAVNMAKLRAAVGAGLGSPTEPISVTINEPKGAWVPKLVKWLTGALLVATVILVSLAYMLENTGLIKAGPQQAEFEVQQGKTYKFSDVHGVDEAKDELREIVEFLKDPTKFSTLGGKLPKGVLLTGPPGTGKTMLARAVAGEAGVPFLFASGSEFDEMFVGVGAKRVRELFSTARKKQPAIIFIDELDAIGGKRNNRDQHYLKQTLNQLLVEMDGFMQSEGVIVIAATNFPDSLDPALVRPGRFDKHVAVPLPDVRGRTQILKHHMGGVTTAPEVDPMILARGTPGFSGADLQNMVNQAAIQASREGAVAVTLKHFEWAKDKIVLGGERKSSFLSDHVKKMTAYHEGGHALVALYTDGAMPLHKVTCVPRGHALGVTSQLPEDDRYSVTRKEYLATIDVCMGGRVAEELIYGPENVTSGASSDIQKATNTARAMVKYWGFSSKIGPVYFGDRNEGISGNKRDEIESEVRKLLVDGESRVKALLASKKDELHRLADALVEHETLDAEEVRKVIRGEKIRDIKEVIAEDLSRMEATPVQSQAQELKSEPAVTES